MAFPTIVDADTKNGVQASNATSWTLTYPTNLAAGDLILACVAADGDVLATWPNSTWVADASGTTGAVTLHLAKKVATGSESGTFTLTLGATESGAWRVFRITGWGGTLGTSWATGTSVVTSSGIGSGGTSANPNPANVSPPDWDVEDTLWIAVTAVDTSRTISVYPLAGRNTADISGGSGGATLGICTTTSAVASLDVGAFTISASDDWGAKTIAIRPAALTAATGTGAGTGTASTSSGTAAETFVGTGGGTGTAATASGTGTSLQAFTGTGAATQATATAVGSGLETISGTGAGTLPPPAAQGSGISLLAVVGSGAGELVAATAAGTGDVAALGEITGSGAGEQLAASATGDGLQVYPGGGVQVPQSAYGEGTVEGGTVEVPVAGSSIYAPRLLVISGGGAGIQARQNARGKGRVNDDDLVVMAA